MEIRRKLLAGAIGLALVAGTVGCGGSDEEAGDEVAETAPDRTTGTAPGRTTGTAPDGTAGGDGTTGRTDGTVDADGDGDADLPPHWPARFVLPERMTLIRAITHADEIQVRGTIEGELDAVVAEFETVVEEAGLGIYEQMTTPSDDQTTNVTRSADAEYDVFVAVAEAAAAPEGELVVDIELNPKAT